MTISPDYYLYGTRFITPDLPDTNAARVLSEYPHQLTYCGECNDGSVVLFDFRGAYAFGELIDISNAAALDHIHSPGITYLHTDGVLCVPTEHDLDDDELSALDDILATHERYTEYPVLDEDDYSRRELEIWDAEITYQLSALGIDASDMSAEWLTVFYDAIGEWYGYAEAGYVADKWVSEAIAAADSARPRALSA